ncbi:unnamed protein product [Blepharisma stoltei]|uniref:FYVE-type domain-containing protein n=1 Tax=Blepharisma stoltei TaxID=1481888 RepID=A0AAU9IKP9_9CILI|nr:unnamed protein product [Blepharisma stoltei]
MDRSFSDVKSLKIQHLRTRSRSLILTEQEHEEDKLLYLNDKLCSICGCLFSLLGPNRKKCCTFCYKAVCHKCSMQKTYNSQTKSMSRLCDNCQGKFIQSNVSMPFTVKIAKVKSAINKLNKKIKQEQSAINEENKKISDLLSKISFLELRNMSANEEKQLKISSLENEIIKLKKEIKELKAKATSLSEVKNDKEKSIRKIKKLIDSVRSRQEAKNGELSSEIVRKSVDYEASSYQESEADDGYHNLTEKIEICGIQSHILKNNLDELVENLTIKDEQIATLTKNISSKSSSKLNSHRSTATSITPCVQSLKLKSEIKTKKKMILALQNELKQYSFLDRQLQAPLSSNPCTCSIQ